MGKRASVEEGIEAVRLFRQAGIETAGFFIVGYPGESEESINQTLALAVSLPLTEISINVPFPLPGSPLFSRIGSIDTTADWRIANEISFIYKSEFENHVTQRPEGKGSFRKKGR
jgi:anaerobic magnesium-protoporphyrin IX monomethyl ester cyclase